MLTLSDTRQRQIFFALITFIVYTTYMNWKIALVIMAGVGFHECCHIWAANYKGLSTGGFYLMPFIGGVATVTDRYKTYAQQAIVVLAGPVGGGLLATLLTIIFYFTNLPMIGAAAAWMTFINLFNLLPLSFMDGGQILQTITFSINHVLGVWTKVISTIIGVIVLIFLNPIIAMIVLFFGGADIYTELNNLYNKNAYSKGMMNLRPKKMSGGEIVLTIVSYLTAIVLLLIQFTWLHSFDVGSLQSIK